MSRTRSLILFLLLASLVACRYGFVLEGSQGGKKVSLDPSTNRTHLREAGMVLDAELEKAFASMGMLSQPGAGLRLSCTIIAATRQRITSSSLKTADRYRLILNVHAELRDASGTATWQSTFSDQGNFSEGGSDEDALNDACTQVSLQIARAVAALQL